MADLTFRERIDVLTSSSSLFDKHRIVPGNHTAFGISVLLNDDIILVQSEGTSHGLIAGTKPVSWVSTDNGVTYTKNYLPLTGISGSGSDDIRNIAGAVDNDGNLWVIATDYVSLNENNCRLWFWRSTNGSTWSNPIQIIYNTTTYPSMTGFGKLIHVGNKLMFSAYGQKSGGVSVAVLFSSTNAGVSWTVTDMAQGDVSLGSNYITETDIQYISGNTIVAVARREDTTPILITSTNLGTSWTVQGALTVATSTKWHAPTLFSEDNKVFCLFSDRINGNIEQISVSQNYTTLSEWNTSTVSVVASSIVQTGFGSYNFGYTGVFGTSENRMLTMYDIALESPTPADIVTNPLTHLVIVPLPLTPKVSFEGGAINATLTGGSTTDDISYDYTLRYVDNYGMLQSDGKTLLIKKDGEYLITGHLKLVQNIAASNYCFLTFSVYNTSDTSNLARTVIDVVGNAGKFSVNLNGTHYLRAGNYVIFRAVLSDSAKTVDLTNQPIFTLNEL